MKKLLITLIFTLVASVGTIFASDTQVDGIWYNFDDSNNTASVTFRGYDYYSYDNEYSGAITIPATVLYNNKTYSVTSIGESAFHECSNLTSIAIPNSITSIGDHVFFGCYSLTSIEIPNSVTSIGYSAFWGCTSLTNPVYNSHVFAYMPTSYTGAYSFPNSVDSIADFAFSSCHNLTSIEIPNNVTSIGYYAFSNCTSLVSVSILNPYVTIKNNIVSGCYELAIVVAPASVLETDKEERWVSFTHSLQSVTFTSGDLTYNVLGILARSYKTLTSLNISGVTNTELDDEAFKGFYNLQSLVLPANLTKIGYMAVADCKNLQSINIPASVTEISQSAFENCRSLKTITFGGQAASVPGLRNTPASSASQLQTIGNWAFYNCHELQNLTIPEGVTSIGDGAFYGCVYLEDLSLPASVQSIGDNTFALCAKLQRIVVNAPVPPSIQAKTFYDVKRQIPVYVPDESVNAYRNDARWSEFDIRGISNMPQGLNQITNDQMPTTHKVCRNSQILILRGDRTYTLTGAEVK